MPLEKQIDEIETILIRSMVDVDDDLADVWVYHRFTPEMVTQYLDLGVINPNVAAVLDEAGFTPKRLARMVKKIQEARG